MKPQPQTTKLPIKQINKHTNNIENRGSLTIPEACPTCGFPNFNIWGVKQNNKLEITITCMKCGKPSHKIVHNS